MPYLKIQVSFVPNSHKGGGDVDWGGGGNSSPDTVWRSSLNPRNTFTKVQESRITESGGWIPVRRQEPPCNGSFATLMRHIALSVQFSLYCAISSPYKRQTCSAPVWQTADSSPPTCTAYTSLLSTEMPTVAGTNVFCVFFWHRALWHNYVTYTNEMRTLQINSILGVVFYTCFEHHVFVIGKTICTIYEIWHWYDMTWHDIWYDIYDMILY